MRFIRTGVALILAVLLTGCGAGGVFNLNPQPDGNIVITNATTGATLQTTSAKPFIVNGGAFSIGLTEDHFSGPFTVTISTWTAPFNISCFVPHYVDQTDKTNILKFAADNAAPVTAPTQPSPCNPFTTPSGVTTTDEETATIADGHGHSVMFYYQLAGAAPAGGGGGSGSTTPARLALSWSGPSPTGSACGAYVLNVGALNASGQAVATTAANPVTLSTTGGTYMGFSSATASAGFTCSANTGGSPGGAPTLQLTTTPTQVLVYFNGYLATATTSITASSLATPPTSLTVGNSTSNTVASIKLVWNGATPQINNCGAFVLNVEAFDSNGNEIVSSAYSNPITVSTSSGYWSGFSTVVAGISPAPAPAALVCKPPDLGPPQVGTPTLAVPNTATPTVVYYDGFTPYGAAVGNTTITATAVGVPLALDGSITF